MVVGQCMVAVHSAARIQPSGPFSRYMTRYIAKNIVAAELVQVGYCIGLVDPVSVMVSSAAAGVHERNSHQPVLESCFFGGTDLARN